MKLRKLIVRELRRLFIEPYRGLFSHRPLPAGKRLTFFDGSVYPMDRDASNGW